MKPIQVGDVVRVRGVPGKRFFLAAVVEGKGRGVRQVAFCREMFRGMALGAARSFLIAGRPYTSKSGLRVRPVELISVTRQKSRKS